MTQINLQTWDWKYLYCYYFLRESVFVVGEGTVDIIWTVEGL